VWDEKQNVQSRRGERRSWRRRHAGAPEPRPQDVAAAPLDYKKRGGKMVLSDLFYGVLPKLYQKEKGNQECKTRADW